MQEVNLIDDQLRDNLLLFLHPLLDRWTFADKKESLFNEPALVFGRIPSRRVSLASDLLLVVINAPRGTSVTSMWANQQNVFLLESGMFLALFQMPLHEH